MRTGCRNSPGAENFLFAREGQAAELLSEFGYRAFWSIIIAMVVDFSNSAITQICMCLSFLNRSCYYSLKLQAKKFKKSFSDRKYYSFPICDS